MRTLSINPCCSRGSYARSPVAPGDDSIDDLRELAVTERPEAMGEILNQAQNQQLCFLQLLTITQTSHPNTFFAMKLAARVGEVVMMRLKRQYNRPRPTQYYPTLYPPLPVPGHSSYPAGHAFIAHLTARVLIEITTGAGGTSPYEQSLLEIGRRHRPQQSDCGISLPQRYHGGRSAGDMTHAFLQGMAPRAVVPPDFDYASVVTAAKTEWN